MPDERAANVECDVTPKNVDKIINVDSHIHSVSLPERHFSPSPDVLNLCPQTGQLPGLPDDPTERKLD